MNSKDLSLRVLLVEDSQLLADQISEVLAATTCTTSIGVVSTEQEAIARSIEGHPDLLILDLHLKQGTGFGVLKALAGLSQRPTVVVLTNYALPQYRDLGTLHSGPSLHLLSRPLPILSHRLPNCFCRVPKNCVAAMFAGHER